jgi:hypothetical protein
MEQQKSKSTEASGEGPATTSHLEAFLKTNPASTGVLAGVVTMSGQLAAQLEVPSYGCRIVALAFALLLAYYQVGIAQRRRLESLFLVPIVAVILFTTGWGANRLIYEHQSGTQPVFHQLQVSLGEWLIEQIIPAAQAQAGGAKGETAKGGGAKGGGAEGGKGGWRDW